MTCTMPVGDNADPCRRPAVCVYVRRADEFPRCRIHDGPKVRATADEKGYARTPLVEKAAS